MLTNPAGGMANSYTYDPYGTQLTAPTGTGSKSNPWRYAGEYYTDTQQYKIGARYYQPNLGRWTQRDPVIDLSGSAEQNRYSYAGCNPINSTDPSGLHSSGCLGKAATLIGGLGGLAGLYAGAPYAAAAAGAAVGAFAAGALVAGIGAFTLGYCIGGYIYD